MSRFCIIVTALGCAALGGCTTPVSQSASASPGGDIVGKNDAPPSSTGTGTGTGTGTTQTTTPATETQTLQEVVYILMDAYDDDLNWFCTGTLVSKDRVVTAGHCLDTVKFKDWSVVAPLVNGAPKVTASNPQSLGDDSTAESADIGVLTLDTPIDLPVYATITDVSAEVIGGTKLSTTAIVRTAEEPQAPFHSVDVLDVRSATDRDYDHGYEATRFSHGGDSGAGIFLVENGAPTHKLIAVERTFEPDLGLDDLTRVDSDFTSWYAQNSGE